MYICFKYMQIDKGDKMTLQYYNDLENLIANRESVDSFKKLYLEYFNTDPDGGVN